MPPVVGLVAFFIVRQNRIEFRYILVAAIVPRSSRQPTSRREWLQRLGFVIPLAVLSYLLLAQPSALKVGFYRFVATILPSLLRFPDFRSGRTLWGTFLQAGWISTSTMVIVTTIGRIVGLIRISSFS